MEVNLLPPHTKICKICHIEKDYSEFHKMKKCIGGVRTVCKECRKEEKKEYRSRDYVIEKQKTYYQDHKVRIRKYLNEHYWSLNGQFHNNKRRAKRDNINFELTEKDCILFYNADCTYCGNKIKGLGIDRIDSKMGYTLNNIVPCCSKCNFMKHVMSKEEFIKHIIQIVKYLKLEI
jgi:hypothetical protein